MGIARLSGEPLADRRVEALIEGLVALAIPTESFPFARRERLRENLRKVYEHADDK